MHRLLSEHTASISELKTSPSKLLHQAKGKSIAILNHNTPSAYLVSAREYEHLLNIVDDYLLSKEATSRLNDNTEPIKVTLDEL